jgi:hypothetical protein
MGRKISVDFYRVEMPMQTTETFNSVLHRIAGSPDDASRNVEMGGYAYRLHQARFERDLCEGEMVRIRMDQVPLKAKLSGYVAPLELEDDEGIGEDMAFLFYRLTNVLVVQRSRLAVSPARFAGYVEARGGLDGPVIFDPLLQKNALQRLNALNAIRKVEVRLTGVDHPEHLKDEAHGLNGVIDLLGQFDAPDVALTLSMGRTRGSLGVVDCLQSIKTLNRVAGENERNFTKLEVHGQRGPQEPEVIDLVKDRVVETFELEPDYHRRISYEARRLALREALRRRMKEVTAAVQQVPGPDPDPEA